MCINGANVNLTAAELEVLSLALSDRLGSVARRCDGDPFATQSDHAERVLTAGLLGRVNCELARVRADRSADLLDSVLL